MKYLILSLIMMTASQAAFAGEKKLTGEKRQDLDSSQIHCKLAALKEFDNQKHVPVVEPASKATKGM